ncbi:MAG TPA: alkaline phosphatase D family protein [Burkholderiaceae bacterium]
MQQDRREFLAFSARLAGSAALAAASLPACARQAGGNDPFAIGVASGSPLPDRVVLWTRVITDPVSDAPLSALAYSVRWEIAEDEGFRRIVNKGTANAIPALAHSVHVDATGLAPDRWYYYRFMLGDAVSQVGRTRTAPRADAQPSLLKVAVASCQHWEFGEYGAHRHIAAANPDLVAFLGDYIYEWGPYVTDHPEHARRTNESFDLDDYRRRYAQYKSDPHLQASHRAAPWLVTWDDHEVANDYADDRDELLTANFLARRAAAYQAFYEHMPIRLPTAFNGKYANLRIYDRYDWGRLARIHLLDNRQYRAHQVCPRPQRGGSNSVTTAQCAARLDPTRSMLGAAQESWLKTGLANSPARWNILAQQTLMAQNTQTAIKQPNDGRFWTDGWDGYPLARERLLDELARSKAANPVVLSGDVHTFYAADLQRDVLSKPSAENPIIATEFCGTSVTSSSRPQERTLQYLKMNPHIHYGRSDTRGFYLMEVTPSKTTTHFMGLEDVDDAQSGVEKVGSFVVENGRPGVVRA